MKFKVFTARLTKSKILNDNNNNDRQSQKYSPVQLLEAKHT